MPTGNEEENALRNETKECCLENLFLGATDAQVP